MVLDSTFYWRSIWNIYKWLGTRWMNQLGSIQNTWSPRQCARLLEEQCIHIIEIFIYSTPHMEEKEKIVVTHIDIMSSEFDKLKQERAEKVKLSYYKQNEEWYSIQQFLHSADWWPSNTEYMLGLSKRAWEIWTLSLSYYWRMWERSRWGDVI